MKLSRKTLRRMILKEMAGMTPGQPAGDLQGYTIDVYQDEGEEVFLGGAETDMDFGGVRIEISKDGMGVMELFISDRDIEFHSGRDLNITEAFQELISSGYSDIIRVEYGEDELSTLLPGLMSAIIPQIEALI